MILLGVFNVNIIAQTYNMGAERTITTCNATLYDNGGASGYYLNNHSDTITIYPANPGSKITITLLEEYISIDDTLFIYNSQNADPSKLINVGTQNLPYTNVSNPIPVNWYTTASEDNLTGAITLRFKSNASSNNMGFKFLITCNTIFSCQPITAAFDTLSTTPTINLFTSSYGYQYNYLNSCQNQPVHFVASVLFPQNNLHYQQSIDSCAISWIIDSDTITQPAGISYLNHTFIGHTQSNVSFFIRDQHQCTSLVTTKIRINSSVNPILATNPPDSMCLGNSQILSVGNDTSNIALTTISVFSEDTTVIIPDGPNCSGLTDCLSLNISILESFQAGETIQLASDIKSVCVKMEHSFLGDLQFKLICPDGRSSIIHSQPNGGSLFLGIPIDDAGGCTPIDSLAGNGWNYCWSNDPAHNYHGASPNYIHQGQTTTSCDATDVANNSNYYHPMNSFAGLVGCPLLGVWQIEICDLYSIDDGWAFNWSLNILNSSNQSSSWNFPSGIQNVDWTGSNITNSMNNNIEVAPTTPGFNYYHATLTDSMGCSYDTTLALYVIGNPIPSFSYFTDLDMATYFTNESQNADTYLWDFGYASAISIVENPSFSYPSDGNYTVVLNASNSNCPNIPSASTSQLISWSNVKVEDVELQNIKIYPNPCEGILNVKFGNDLYSNSELSICDITGKIVYSSTVNIENRQATLNLSTLKPGIYNLSLKNNTQVFNTVFLKK